MSTPSFKLSQVDPLARSYLPFVALLGKSEMEVTAGVLIAACQHYGDVWQALRPPQISAWLRDVGRTHERWGPVVTNPFATRWAFDTLIERGWARWADGAEGDRTGPIELTDAFFALLVDKEWVLC